ncbi:hypothetical protein [Cellulophaga tyrosinoxydans]|nr:hypothetical protein [Cellulophaga tyrosinoxydans]
MKKQTHIFRMLFYSVFIIFTVNSCALKPVNMDASFTKFTLEKVDLNDLGNGKVLFYNGSDVLHNLDNTGRLNIWIDKKVVGQIKPKEYLILSLQNGNYLLTLLHIDVVKMKKDFNVEITNKTKVIRIEPTITSNKLTITNELPKNFDKFKYVGDN